MRHFLTATMALSVLAFAQPQTALAGTVVVSGQAQLSGGEQNSGGSYSSSDPVATSGSTGNGLSSASADLVTGTLHVVARGAEPLFSNGSLVSFPQSAANATLQETIHIVGTILVPVVATVRIHVDGTLTPLTPSVEQGLPSQIRRADSPVLSLSFDLFGGTQESDYGGTLQTSGCTTANNTASLECLNGTTFDKDIFLSVTISDANRTFGIIGNLNAAAFGGGIADFGDTAAFSISLPDQLSFTSDSGLFLTAPTNGTSVPEPATLALLSGSILGLGVIRRRRSS